LDAALGRYRALVNAELRESIAAARAGTPPAPASAALLEGFYGQVDYHFGWRDADLRPTTARSGKLLRPALLLLCCELAAHHARVDLADRDGVVRTALPAATAIELVHNFSLVHDDIEDRDEERHHRATMWKLWGEPHAINTGDGIFAIARLEL